MLRQSTVDEARWLLPGYRRRRMTEFASPSRFSSSQSAGLFPVSARLHESSLYRRFGKLIDERSQRESVFAYRTLVLPCVTSAISSSHGAFLLRAPPRSRGQSRRARQHGFAVRIGDCRLDQEQLRQGNALPERVQRSAGASSSYCCAARQSQASKSASAASERISARAVSTCYSSRPTRTRNGQRNSDRTLTFRLPLASPARVSLSRKSPCERLRCISATKPGTRADGRTC